MQVMSEFEGGVYARYKVSGDVRVRVAEVCAQRGDAFLVKLRFQARLGDFEIVDFSPSEPPYPYERRIQWPYSASLLQKSHA